MLIQTCAILLLKPSGAKLVPKLEFGKQRYLRISESPGLAEEVSEDTRRIEDIVDRLISARKKNHHLLISVRTQRHQIN